MFSRRQRPIAFDPYRSRRSPRRVPRWLLLLLLGSAAGAGGVVYVQERVLPPRLSAAASEHLRTSLARARDDEARLAAELGSTQERLAAALSEKKALGDGLAASRSSIERLSGDLAAVVEALPPDPRNGTVEVRAARFTVKGGQLEYDLVLTRGRSGDKPLPGQLKLVLAGDSPQRAGDASAALKPVGLSIGAHEVVRGSAPLPEGFKPRQTTVQVLDKSGDKLLGMRVLPVK